MIRIALLVALVAAGLAVPRQAYAYPQYQLSRDTTCTACHVSPDGGGMLNENGESVSEATAWLGGSGAVLYGLKQPGWLGLGGDVRAAAGFVDPGTASGAGYPMQVEAAASAHGHGFTLHVVGGFRTPKEGGTPLHVVWSREHYLMWQSNPDENHGFYVRAGRLMPTFGLRLAEHIDYPQKYGGFPLYGEAYGVSASYVRPELEVHATGFVHDPLITTLERGDGGAFYAEVRLGQHAAIGADAKYAAIANEQTHTYAGLTGKLYLPGPDLLFQAEAELIRQHLTVGAGDRNTQLAGYLMATHPFGGGLMLDVGLGHYTEDTRVKGLFRDCVDANLHWFVTPHTEWLFTTRLELLDAGGGPNGGYALIQLHYRL